MRASVAPKSLPKGVGGWMWWLTSHQSVLNMYACRNLRLRHANRVERCLLVGPPHRRATAEGIPRRDENH